MELYRHKVHYYETDKMGIVHHSNYLRWMEEARLDFLMQLNCGYDKLEGMGIISPVTAASCKYKESAYFPEVILINVTVEEFKGVKLKLFYEMTREDGTLIFEGHTEHGFINSEGKIISLKREHPEIYDTIRSQIKA